jgi:polar amino acid transport system substrate-binding protein
MYDALRRLMLAVAAARPARTAGSAGRSPKSQRPRPHGKLRAAINLAVILHGDRRRSRAASRWTWRARPPAAPADAELVTFEAAGKVFEALKAGAWDIAFIAIEPVRAAEIDFSAPYVFIEGTYMVPKDSPLQEIADVDRAGVRIAIGRGSVYDLYLARTIKHATLVRAHIGGGRAMIELFLAEKLEAAAGVKQALMDYAKTHATVRVMDALHGDRAGDGHAQGPRRRREATCATSSR